MNNNPHYESDILFNDACYVAEKVVSLSLEELNNLSFVAKNSSLATRTGIDCAKLFKLGEHNHFNGLVYSVVRHLIDVTAPR